MNTTGKYGKQLTFLFILLVGLALVLILLPGALQTARAEVNVPAAFCDETTGITLGECEALVALYNSTDGPNWTDNTGWLVSNTPCGWYGVQCININVHQIHLTNNQLSGSLPTELGNLFDLRELSLGGNDLSGDIPASFSSLVNLDTLILGGNQFSGGFPEEFLDLPYLREIFLGDNQFSGEIPASLGDHVMLNYLDLSRNQFSGAIPPQLGQLINLEGLLLNNNQLSGTIPASLGNLTALRSLNLSFNPLSGPIPTELEQLDALEVLRLNGIPFNSPIPPELGSLSSLRELYLGSNTIDNGINGSIPPELGDLSELEVLDLSYSYGLTGTLPAELGSLSKLRILNLAELAFVGGTIPATFGELLELEQFSMGEASLEGPIPPELANLDKLQLLDLSRNQLSGSIPPALGSMPALQALDLSVNKLSGSIPAELGELTGLVRLCLEANALEGEIPPSITNLVNLNQSDPRWWNCRYSDEGITTLDYNSLYSSDPAVLAFLADKSPGWDATQTVAPTDLHVAAVYSDSLDLGWTPILYTQDGGYYEVFTASEPGGVYSLAGSTLTKTDDQTYLAGFQPGESYYFQVRTFTPANPNNAFNDLWSEFTPPLGLTFDQFQPEITGTLTITDTSSTVAEISAPPGSVTDSVTMALSSLETVSAAANLSFASLAFELSAYVDGTLQEDFTFAVPVTVTIRYTDLDVADLDENTLTLYFRDEATGEWLDAATTCTPSSTYQRNTAENWLALPICHLSQFGLFTPDWQRLYLPVVGS